MQRVDADPGTEIGVDDQGDEGTEHVERAMGEIDDVEHAEDDGQPQAQHGVEHAVVEAQHALGEDQPHHRVDLPLVS